MKQEGKPVPYNDILRFNQEFGPALIEDSSVLFWSVQKIVNGCCKAIPGIDELCSLMARYTSDVRVAVFGDYRYALSTNTRSQEFVLTGT